MLNIAFLFNLLALIVDICTWLLTFIILITIFHYIIMRHLRNSEKIIFQLQIYIHLIIFVYTSITISNHIQTYLGDTYGIASNSFGCLFKGYAIFIPSTMFYSAFVNQVRLYSFLINNYRIVNHSIQALFRLSRIVYSSRRYLQNFRLYMILPLINFLQALIVLTPLLFRNSVTYLSDEYYCFIKFTDRFEMIWMAFIIYATPMIILAFFYWKITSFIRQQSIIQRRQYRDILIIRRIFTVVILIAAIAFPAFVFMIMSLISGTIYYLSYRIMWPLISLGLLASTISLVVLTPPVKRIFEHRFDCNVVRPFIY